MDKLKQALSNYKEKLAEYEYELSITATLPQKFELRKRIQECKDEIKRLEGYLLDDGMKNEGIISHRHLTSINEYPVLGFLQDIFPSKLLNILQIKSTPLIYKNEVWEHIERFAIETGNINLISSSYNDASEVDVSFTSNKKGLTISGSLTYDYFGEIEVFEQSQKDYENDTLRCDSEHQEFFYAPVDVPLKLDRENARWTCICRQRNSNEIRGFIYQYPELGNLIKEGCRDLNSPERIREQWILEIAKQNPTFRGFLLYGYYFTSDASNPFPFCDLPHVSRIASSPYLRFLHIRNESSRSVFLESLQLRCLKNHRYQLTNVKHRSENLKQAEIINEELKISLTPGQDLLIPIEFGFDAKSQLKYTSYLDDQNPSAYFTNEAPILVIKPLSSKERNNIESNIFKQEYFADWKYLQQDFIRKTRSLSELNSISPERFAVGTFMDIRSIRFDGKELSISSPNDNPKISMSTYFLYGSCPYLFVFNSRKKYWIEMGPILYGRRNQQMEYKEIYMIDGDISKIKIEERDPEITFLSSVKLTYTDYFSKNRLVVECLDINSSRNNQGYCELHQGQYLEFDLKNILPKKAMNIQLSIVGYYELIKF